ncbi:endonuclease MutS2 [Granulicella arctica]|uniref:endonuclease MutS2 n=1 Tax=Granulicella arctica TaxID=940613 RepID=UPI0021DFDDBA|nr:Smr/MutS family protein [Granulicella arctica]
MPNDPTADLANHTAPQALTVATRAPAEWFTVIPTKIGVVPVLSLLPVIPSPLAETSAVALEWSRLREYLAGKTVSPLGRAWVTALEPSGDRGWIDQQHQRTQEIRTMLVAGGSFTFHGLFDPTTLLDKARIEGSALEGLEIASLLAVVERVAAWHTLIDGAHDAPRYNWPSISALSAPLLEYDLAPLLRLLRGKIEPDGSLSDDASPALRGIRKAMERQHRAIEESLRRAARQFREEGSTQSSTEDLITIRGERFVIPVKAEFKRKVPGVIHGSSSSGQTVYVEPLETIEQNNELVRLLDEEQAEIHRILVVMTGALGQNATAIHLGSAILAEVEAHTARARFAMELNCNRPIFGAEIALTAARHPLLELRMKAGHREAEAEGPAPTPVPLTILLPPDAKQLIISGPNTGGKTVSLKTLGLLALMAQAGVPVPAEEAKLPLFSAIYADIGDAQSIERNLSSFSAHVVNVDRISRVADAASLVLLDELGSATDPEEGAALAVAVASHFLALNAWCAITTHLTSLKVYAANHAGVLNAAVGFDQYTLSPTYELRLGVPGASAGLNIAARLGMDPTIIENARANMTTQTADIGAFLDQLHAQLSAAATARETLQQRERELSRERAKLEVEGRIEQKARTRELEVKLNSLISDFEYQLKETVKAIDDKTVSQKIARDSALRMTRLRREFSEQFNSTVVAHNTGADKKDPAAQPHIPRGIKVGDLVKLKSLGRQARVDRLIDEKTYEVSIGPMKMRIDRADVAEVESVKVITPLEAARKRGGITIQTSTSGDSDYMASEINVIGRNAEEAQDEVERFLDRAFLAGLPRIRIVHGTGMGVLRRTLREFLRKHPHVTTVTEPAHNQGGQGATEVELRQ